VLDLHLHTTASDGRCTPAELVTRVAAAGVRTFAVTDHDTVAAIDEVATLAHQAGLRLVTGIEVTAVANGRDVHVLGYFFDHRSALLADFLAAQRALRIARVRRVGEGLAAIGHAVDVEALVDAVVRRPGASIGRPAIARALVQAGHASSVQDAFDRLIGEGRPAYVPRTGRGPAEVIEVLHAAGGVASLAHPAVTRQDDLIPGLAEAGLDALEAYHADHSAEDATRYAALAARLGLAVSGGSDYHGEPDGASGDRRRVGIGQVLVPPRALEELEARAARRART
jgi:predicted metal-dependent phosphoesterase TrpH